MFGNPFKRNLSRTEYPAERCRWCLKRIGLDGPYPVPVCEGCFHLAYSNPSEDSPKGNLWERMTGEFPAEFKVWVKRMRTTPDRLEVLTTSTDGLQEIRELRTAQEAADAAGDRVESQRIETLIQEKITAISTFKKEMPALIDALEMSERDV